jgi:NAD(P)H-nitrite reductase large subunit
VPRYVIVGSGVAGISAIEAIRDREPGADILLIGNEQDGYYSRPGLAYYLTGEVVEKQLYPYSEGDYRRLNFRWSHGEVVRICPQERLLELKDGGAISYERLLLAVGASAALPSMSGLDLEGVVTLDDFADARRIVRLSRKARAAVVVGGGITALELVEGLRARGVKTHYFLRRDRYWGNVLDETESRIVEHRLKEEGVQIHYQTDLREIVGQRSRVVGVRTQDGKQIRCDVLAIAIGIRPRLQLAATGGLETDRGVLVNEFLQTSDAHIYAAGDVAQAYDPLSGRHVLDSLWGPARQQGYTAGLNMTGQSVSYRKEIAFNVTRLAGLTTTIIGTVGRGRDDDLLLSIARGDSETWRQMPDAIAAQSDFDVNRVRVMVGDSTLIGAIVMGDQTLSFPLQRLITEQIDISNIRAQLLQPDAPITDVIADFWTAWRRNNHHTS